MVLHCKFVWNLQCKSLHIYCSHGDVFVLFFVLWCSKCLLFVHREIRKDGRIIILRMNDKVHNVVLCETRETVLWRWHSGHNWMISFLPNKTNSIEYRSAQKNHLYENHLKALIVASTASKQLKKKRFISLCLWRSTQSVNGKEKRNFGLKVVRSALGNIHSKLSKIEQNKKRIQKRCDEIVLVNKTRVISMLQYACRHPQHVFRTTSSLDSVCNSWRRSKHNTRHRNAKSPANWMCMKHSHAAKRHWQYYHFVCDDRALESFQYLVHLWRSQSFLRPDWSE